MLYRLHVYSKTRKFWIILILSGTGLESISLLMQYLSILQPCILCIYQRCAVIGIILAGIISIIAPNTFLRFLGMSIWLYSSIQGLYLTKKQIYTTLYPSKLITCDLFVKFPYWFPLHEWCPTMFNTTHSDCFTYPQYFLLLEISQWTLLIFTSYFISSVTTIISQFIYFKTKHNIKKR